MCDFNNEHIRVDLTTSPITGVYVFKGVMYCLFFIMYCSLRSPYNVIKILA